MNSKDRFRDHVQGVAFSLTLSKRMIEAIAMLVDNDGAWCSASTANALIERGLAEHVEINGRRRFKLSEAGEALVPLLLIADVWPRHRFEQVA